MTFATFALGALMAAADASASASPAATPACRIPFMDVELSQRVSPRYPENARLHPGSVAVVLVLLTVDPTGAVLRASVSHSSGDVFVDEAAIAAARTSTYRPKIVDCEAAAGTYIFRADFKVPRG